MFGLDPIRILVSMATFSPIGLKLGRRCEHFSNLIFDWKFFILAGKVDNYGISDAFEIRPDQTTDCRVSCP